MSARTPHFSGVYTALVTPFLKDKVNYADLAKLVEEQVAAGVAGVVAVGTTGESPTLCMKEHVEVIAKTVEFARGRIKVLAGTGSNATYEALELTQQADQAGVDGMLVVAPYYNKPSQEGLYRHFSVLAEASPKPVMLYSIPGRCGIEIGVDTSIRLAKAFPHVKGIKEAGGSCARAAALVDAAEGLAFDVMCGDDSLTLPFMSLGATGIVSVASNFIAGDMVKMTAAALNNDYATATRFAKRYHRLFGALFIEPNPVPTKFALHRAGRIASAEVRLPLTPMEAATEAKLLQVLRDLGL